MRRGTLALLAGLALAPARAQVPARLEVQGALGGLPAGPATLTHRLYRPGSAEPVHAETDVVDVDAAGVYRATLGGGAALDLAAFEGPLELGIQLAGEAEFAPRQRVAAAPYALRADSAEGPSPRVLTLAEDGGAGGPALVDLVAGITDASASNPYLIRLGPGSYDLLLETLALPDHVSLQGAGRGQTTLFGEGAPVVRLGANSRVSDLRVLAPRVGLGWLLTGEALEVRRVDVEIQGAGGLDYVGIEGFGGWISMQDVRVHLETTGPLAGVRGIGILGGGGVLRGLDSLVSTTGDLLAQGNLEPLFLAPTLAEGFEVVGSRLEVAYGGTGFGGNVVVAGGSTRVSLRDSRLACNTCSNAVIRAGGSTSTVFVTRCRYDATQGFTGAVCGLGNYDEDFANIPGVACP